MEVVQHPLQPIYNKESSVLILGTMPSPASREAGFYYAHPQNRFWRVLAGLFDESVPQTIDERTAFALRHHIALWDVLASCEIAGASDASIANPLPNNLAVVFDNAPIRCVFTTGKKAAQLYQCFDAPLYPNVTHKALPSTSSANAAMSLDDLVEAYQAILRELM
ncbi:DNA-deoxyinosine glycosylase [Eggerthellaceae bacterium 3-80]|nr:DNA-deoxyinosine glycosylase [bacterium D16-34]